MNDQVLQLELLDDVIRAVAIVPIAVEDANSLYPVGLVEFDCGDH